MKFYTQNGTVHAKSMKKFCGLAIKRIRIFSMEDDIMAITGVGGTYGSVFEGGYVSSQKEVTGNAKVVNNECTPTRTMTFGENENCGVSGKISEKKNRRKKYFPQGHYQKRKRLREQFEEQMAKKEYLKEYLKGRMAEEEKQEVLLKKSMLSKEQNTARFIERYEESILRL